MDEDLRILEEEYCPPVDPALVSAILSDYAGQPDAIGQARQILDIFKETATAEQLTDFDASGNSSGLHESPGKRSNDADSNADTWATQTTLTDHSHISSELAAMSLDGKSGSSSEGLPDGGYWKDVEQYTTPKKENVLAETFPSLRLDLIAYTLKKCEDDLDKATDELLNHVFFEDSRASPTEEGSVAKGIDAFSEDYHVPQRSKKGKNKKRQKLALSSLSSANTSDSEPMSPITNHWANTSRDVGYITSRTNLGHKTVASIYHANGASLSATVLALVRKEIQAHKKDGEPDAALVQDAIGLNEAFPNIDLEYALALVRLTDPSVTKAHDLAKALMEVPASETGGKGGIKLDLRYAPVNLAEEEPASPRLPVLAPSARFHDSTSLARARGDAFQQASAAYRKGKSTPLMRQAAGYYAQEGRNYNANLKAMSQVEADSFVAAQSGTTYLDLHGVTVADATRIAKQRTQVWWDSLGERRIREWGNARGGVGEGYRIVTGLGRHSEGGRGKLTPAVLKTLISDGWKVEVGTGELLVTGHSRRK
ncbi:hypothetical protein HBH53_148970 [Parastagonospora nodorum]|nr:hypothetical protein HBH53_148970 [Parastagonospora nodorum]KAH4855549.1 hypothetical protein HBH75_081900 [Parastagonospora nodorum]KAH4901339.1 hypothetical protein HBI80_146300 [Parastagonospora nodorum]KAH5034980.1 hypothetical protein HBI75_092340 [Parastagonospora nodorum]KAH5048612.1 hypothetical protein HBH96_210460 [Parastagonospora nodorum]